MKRIYLLVFSFLIFLSSTSLVLDLLSFNAFTAKLVLAQTSAASTGEEKVIIRVDYELPYPGLLPDSPLYFLRIMRDKIVSFLISDPLKKTEFNLLQADKRLNAGIYLFDKRKVSLALSTVSKAENYFEEALDRLEDAKKQGKNVDQIEGKLRNALGRHRQEMELFVGKANGNFKQNFEKELKRVINFEKRLNS